MKRNAHILKRILLGAAVVLAVLVCIGIVAVQSANAGNKLQESNIFGIGENRFNVDSQIGVISKNDFETEGGMESGHTSLATFCTRDITTALSSLSFKIEMAAQAAAAAAKAEEMLKINQAKNNRLIHINKYGLPAELSEINWDQGKEAFIAEWTTRINKYLAGSALENMGETFATAAWECGIDPRWSPAISNTESGKGAKCFASHNAWGWGDSGWPTWEDAIFSHVKGLATKYSYTIARPLADKYCPPNSEHWYSATLTEMLNI